MAGQSEAIKNQKVAVLGAFVACWFISIYAILSATSAAPLAAPLVFVFLPLYWLAIVTSWCAALPEWFVPITRVGLATGAVAFLLLAWRRRWALALLGACVSFHLGALVTAQVLVGTRIPARAAALPGERVSFEIAGALDMMRNGTSMGIRCGHASVVTSEGRYRWSFFEDRFVPVTEPACIG